MPKSGIKYPWLSSLVAFVIIAWQYLLNAEQELSQQFLPALLQSNDILPLAIGLGIGFAFFDHYRFRQSKLVYQSRLEALQLQINDLHASRRKLGTQVQTFSDHAEKLKLFISNRLLENIEYDEKFLHFKNIASEVRHNGVISYDKIQTALEAAIDKSNETDQEQFSDARQSLIYLWDLLDLSTTDNIGLHIANKIYDCEEIYFQSLLQDGAQTPTSFEPTFSILSAIKRALRAQFENTEALQGLSDKPGLNTCQDDNFYILIESDNELLGNPNHIVLLMENLVNNAIFYANKKSNTARHSKVCVTLSVDNTDVVLKVYNHGPIIKDRDGDQIYQLGYSSRRKKDNHGKGLGLYFVNEITKGFEGQIDYENKDNKEFTLGLRVELKNGEIFNYNLHSVKEDSKLLSRLGDDGDLSRKIELPFHDNIKRIEIFQQESHKNNRNGCQQPDCIEGFVDDQTRRILDQNNQHLPTWVITVKNHKYASSLEFVPLDLIGVEFTVRIPTAKSRLDA